MQAVLASDFSFGQFKYPFYFNTSVDWRKDCGGGGGGVGGCYSRWTIGKLARHRYYTYSTGFPKVQWRARTFKAGELDDRNAREARPGVMPLFSLLINSNIPKISESDRKAGPNLKFTMFTQTTMHLVYPPKFAKP